MTLAEVAMSTLVVENLPDDIHERLRQLAKRNQRSVTEQTIKLIESGVSGQSDMDLRPSPSAVAGARAMSREELETALNDRTYSRYQSADELNAYLDELRG